MANGKEQLIRERAYDLWEQAGRPHGRHDEFWALAAREVQSDEDGEDPVPIDAVPDGGDLLRTRRADVDRLTPVEATAATMPSAEVSVPGSVPEGSRRKPL